ncbi:uncharacterized protein DS421_7g214160 [Arachis hypogaea]|nr:uncharacterized protein DS421_7g214160 [Arachis hypogaea]
MTDGTIVGLVLVAVLDVSAWLLSLQARSLSLSDLTLSHAKHALLACPPCRHLRLTAQPSPPHGRLCYSAALSSLTEVKNPAPDLLGAAPSHHPLFVAELFSSAGGCCRRSTFLFSSPYYRRLLVVARFSSGDVPPSVDLLGATLVTNVSALVIKPAPSLIIKPSLLGALLVAVVSLSSSSLSPSHGCLLTVATLAFTFIFRRLFKSTALLTLS